MQLIADVCIPLSFMSATDAEAWIKTFSGPILSAQVAHTGYKGFSYHCRTLPQFKTCSSANVHFAATIYF